MIRINLTTAGIPATQAELAAMVAKLKPGGGMASVLGRAAANVLKEHFRQRNTIPNRLGGARTNFWAGVAAGVQNPTTEGRSVVVEVSHPAIAQKVFGGTIVPRKVKNLAIPVSARSHGRSPRTFALLAWLPRKAGAHRDTTGYLVEGEKRTRTRGPRKGTEAVRPKPGGALLYVLRKQVDQAKDPLALPSASQFLAPMLKAGRMFLRMG